ncbi:MAG TPA: peptidoglycan endopeptidase [Sphingomicrobium sp.]|nr:peptidoglycan endopeptidase [Sphingomicrobium sp.]
MSSAPGEIIRRARSLVGTRFRPQGRDPRTGLDCIGLVLCAFDLGAGEFRKDYRLRGAHLREVEEALAQRFRRVSARRSRAADIFLCRISADQTHLAINCGESFIHADARIRRVVETPGRPEWTIVAAFRTRSLKRRSN